MRYDIEVGGRTRQVVVTRAGDGFAVTLDAHVWQVDAAHIGAHTMSLVVDGVSRKSHDVVIAADPGSGQLIVRVGTTPVAVTVNGTRRWGRKDEGAGRGGGPQRIAAPMPGKIVRVLVKPGDAVHARQPLVVVEAMKMENELRAGRDGTVAEMHAGEGMSVDAGALLVVIQ
jgi:biotin carboxyl carrier protein